MDTPLHIRVMQDADTPSLVALLQSCDLVRPWNDPIADIAQARRAGCAEILLALLGQEIVASTMVGDDGHRGWLYYVAVAPVHRKKGLDRRIVAAAEDWLKARGREKTQLMVRADNTNVREFYAALGYGEQPRIIMARWLDGCPLTP